MLPYLNIYLFRLWNKPEKFKSIIFNAEKDVSVDRIHVLANCLMH